MAAAQASKAGLRKAVGEGDEKRRRRIEDKNSIQDSEESLLSIRSASAVSSQPTPSLAIVFLLFDDLRLLLEMKQSYLHKDLITLLKKRERHL